MLSEHTSKQYDAELESIRAKVLEMGGLVEQQIVNALEALTRLDPHLAKEVMLTDTQVNQLEVQVDEECSRIIARRQPAASDLRMVMTIVKTITDLERIGDEATKIARTAQKIFEEDRMYKPRFNEIKTMVSLVSDMLRTALDSFARLDVSRTVDVARQDELVDEHFRAATRQLITYMLEDPRTITMSLEVLFVAKAVERIGDHAKNIAEYVVYMVKGIDVRHVSMQEMERETLGN
jgi:phosphate transport system protein